MVENEKGKLTDLDYRTKITKVRGGWTKEKIQKELKRLSTSNSELLFQKEIAKFDSPEHFGDNVFYHGSNRIVHDLKPSIVLKMSDDFGGGSGEQYYGISLSRDRDMASNFTGVSDYGYVAPVILKRDAVVKTMPELSDSIEIEDIVVDLWTEGVDAVIIGDHTKEHSEQEIVILNPKCIMIGKSQSFKVFNKAEMKSLRPDEIEDMWLNSGKKYKEIAERDWETSNIAFKEKYGRSKDLSSKWNSRQKNVYDFHECNVELYEEVKKLKLGKTEKPEVKPKKRKPKM